MTQVALVRQSEQDRAKVAAGDSMLEDQELRATKLRYWQRCKLRFSAEVCNFPREQGEKNKLCIFPIWKVKSLQHQLSVTQKKRKVSELLFTEKAEEDEPSRRRIWIAC